MSHHAVGKGRTAAAASAGQVQRKGNSRPMSSMHRQQGESPRPMEIKFLQVLLPEPWGRLEPSCR